MTTRFVAVRDNVTADDALAAVRTSPDVESFHYVYVVDADGPSQGGGVGQAACERAARDGGVDDNENRRRRGPRSTRTRRASRELVRKYDFSAVPVVDGDNRIARHSDVR